jgi:hypothetical protein
MKDFICPRCESHIRTQKHIPIGGKIQCGGCGCITTLTPENTNRRQAPPAPIEKRSEPEPLPKPKPLPEIHNDGKPLPPSIISLSSLMWILIPVYIAIMLVVLSQIASVESFLQWAFWTGIALFCGIGFIHAYCTFNIRNRTCTKCGAYGLWRQIHLVDTKVVPALLTREERHYDREGNFTGTTRSQYEGEALQYIIEYACYCPHCNESWYENRHNTMSIPKGKCYVDDLEHLIRVAKAEDHGPDLA